MAQSALHPRKMNVGGYNDSAYSLKSQGLSRATYMGDTYMHRSSHSRHTHAPTTYSVSRGPQARRSGMETHTPATGASNGQRRRIAVACSRCRKRKIRCSGDPGDRTGCANCKSAGEAEHCVFLRVSSTTLDLNVPSANYPSAAASIPVMIPTLPQSTSFYAGQTGGMLRGGGGTIPLNLYLSPDASQSSLADHGANSMIYSSYGSSRPSVSETLNGDMTDGGMHLQSSSQDSSSIGLFSDSLRDSSTSSTTGLYGRHSDLSIRPAQSTSDRYYDSIVPSSYPITPLPSRSSSVAGAFYEPSTYPMTSLQSSVSSSIMSSDKILGSNDTRMPVLPQPALLPSSKLSSLDHSKSSYNSTSSSGNYNSTYTSWNHSPTNSYLQISSQKSLSGYASNTQGDSLSQPHYNSSYSSSNSGYTTANGSSTLASIQNRSAGSPDGRAFPPIAESTSADTSNADSSPSVSADSHSQGSSVSLSTSSRETTTFPSSLELGNTPTSISVGK